MKLVTKIRKQHSCPCPTCFKCCCHKVAGLDPQDCVNGDEGVCTCK